MNVATKPNAFAPASEAALAPVVLTQKQKLLIAADALKAKGGNTVYRTIAEIENMTASTFANYPVAGTPLEVIANALTAHVIPTEHTLSGVMTSLDGNQADAHALICACHEQSEVILGSVVESRLRHVANHIQ